MGVTWFVNTMRQMLSTTLCPQRCYTNCRIYSTIHAQINNIVMWPKVGPMLYQFRPFENRHLFCWFNYNLVQGISNCGSQPASESLNPPSWVESRAWPIHRQHSPSGPIVGQSEPSANDGNRWPVRADVSRWCYSLNSPSHGPIGHPCRTIQGLTRYLPLMTVQALREVSVCDEARPTTHAVLFKFWGGYLSLIKLFYYLVGPTIISPGLDWMW